MEVRLLLPTEVLLLILQVEVQALPVQPAGPTFALSG